MSQCEVKDKGAWRKKIHYVGAIVLGMNDALVEMMAALAGFTIGLGENRLIILAGITTGVAATLSMSCAEFLSDEVGETHANSLVSSLLTGVAYLAVVVMLLSPYFIVANPWHALFYSFLLACVLIVIFSLGVSRIRCIPFSIFFLKMFWISFFVALVSFAISWAANAYWGLQV